MTKQIIPYQPQDIQEPKEIVDAVRARRGGTLMNLDRMLLNSPALTRGWNSMLKEIRQNLSLNDKHKEIGMCGVAILNRAEYEFFHHAPPFIKAGGSEEQVQALRLIGQADFPKTLFSSIENDAVELTFQMTRNIQVESALMKRLQIALGNTDAVELVTVIAAYNMVSRFLIALDVNPEEDPPE